VSHLKQVLGVSHGFANGIVPRYRERGSAPSNDDALVDLQYAGAKAGLRPIYDAVIVAVTGFGADVEVAPKRTGVSLRRSKQFAVVEAASAKRVQMGIQLKGEPVTDRLLAGNAMCSHKVNLTDVERWMATWSAGCARRTSGPDPRAQNEIKTLTLSAGRSRRSCIASMVSAKG